MKKPKNLTIVIFGTSGDLTYRKLVPALYTLYNQKMMPEIFQVIGVSRSEISNESFREKMSEGIMKFPEKLHLNDKQVTEFVNHLYYYEKGRKCGFKVSRGAGCFCC